MLHLEGDGHNIPVTQEMGRHVAVIDRFAMRQVQAAARGKEQRHILFHRKAVQIDIPFAGMFQEIELHLRHMEETDEPSQRAAVPELSLHEHVLFTAQDEDILPVQLFRVTVTDEVLHVGAYLPGYAEHFRHRVHDVHPLRCELARTVEQLEKTQQHHDFLLAVQRFVDLLADAEDTDRIFHRRGPQMFCLANVFGIDLGKILK